MTDCHVTLLLITVTWLRRPCPHNKALLLLPTPFFYCFPLATRVARAHSLGDNENDRILPRSFLSGVAVVGVVAAADHDDGVRRNHNSSRIVDTNNNKNDPQKSTTAMLGH